MGSEGVCERRPISLMSFSFLFDFSLHAFPNPVIAPESAKIVKAASRAGDEKHKIHPRVFSSLTIVFLHSLPSVEKSLHSALPFSDRLLPSFCTYSFFRT